MTVLRMAFDPRRRDLDRIEQGLLGIEFDFANRAISLNYEAGTAIDVAAIREYCRDLNSPEINVFIGNELVII